MSDKAPYVITLIIAIVGWIFTHVTDRLLNTPMLLYNSEQRSLPGKFSTYVTLKNITRKTTFRNIEVLMTAAANDNIIEAAVIPIEPSSEGDQAWSVEGRTFQFTFPEIQPGGQFEISVTHQTSAIPSMRFSAKGDTVYAVRPSLETYLVQNELSLLFGFAAASLVLLLVVIWLGSSARRECHDT